MKKLIIILFAFSSFKAYSQIKMYQLPKKTTYSKNDYLMITDSSELTSKRTKRLSLSLFNDMVHDSVTAVRLQFIDSLSDIHSIIAGGTGGAWSKTGTNIYPTSSSDNLTVGNPDAIPLYKLTVKGDIGLWNTEDVNSTIWFNNGAAYITYNSSTGNFTLRDHSTGALGYTLSQLKSGTPVSNGLTLSGGYIKLGGTLSANTEIDADENDFLISNAKALDLRTSSTAANQYIY